MKRSGGGRIPRWTISAALFVFLRTATAMPRKEPLARHNRVHRLGPIGLDHRCCHCPSSRTAADDAAEDETCPATCYTWSAAVDRIRGTASSKETSKVSCSTETRAKPKRRDLRPSTTLSRILFTEYPVWLCRGTTSLGLLQAIPLAKGGYEIRTRLWGIHLLTFGGDSGGGGMLQRLFLPVKQAAWPVVAGKAHHCCSSVVWPITGGLLALGEPKKSDMGALHFTLQTKISPPTSGGNARSSSSSSSSIVTAIQGYRPTLCGRQKPIHVVRSGLYLGTQSLVHAHVMWRFHRHCRQILQIPRRNQK